MEEKDKTIKAAYEQVSTFLSLLVLSVSQILLPLYIFIATLSAKYHFLASNLCLQNLPELICIDLSEIGSTVVLSWLAKKQRAIEFFLLENIGSTKKNKCS